MPERTVLASFLSRSDAEHAANQVQQLGARTTQVAELHPYGGVRPDPRNQFLISGDIDGLASVTLNTRVNRDIGVMLAADPAASGLSDGDGNITGRNYLLTVVCPEHLVDQVVDTIKSCNGYT